MKNLLKVVLMVLLSFATMAKAYGDGPSTVVGTVWLTNEGQIKVIWDELTLEGGEIGPNGATLPVMVLDLKKLLGVNWADSVVLKMSPASYSNDPQRGSKDVQVGTISFSLGEKIVSNGAWDFSISETASGTPLFKRTFLDTGKIYEGTPVSLSIDSQLVRHFSNDVAVSLAVGVYGSVTRSLSNGEVSHGEGVNLNAEVSQGKYTFGFKENDGAVEPPHSDSKLKVVNTTAYVRYTLSQTENREQTITLSFTKFGDESIPMLDGAPHAGKKIGIQYSVRF